MDTSWLSDAIPESVRCPADVVPLTYILSTSLEGERGSRLSKSAKQAGRRTARNERGVVCALGLASFTGCASTLSVLGVYFPAWLVCAVVGLVVAYALVRWMGRHSGSRTLADSGLMFCSLTVVLALSVWWIFFSGF
jgi:hypothetical protein